MPNLQRLTGNFYPAVYVRAATTIPTWITKSQIDSGLSSWTELDTVEKGAAIKTEAGDTYTDTKGNTRRASVKFDANLPELNVEYDQIDAIQDLIDAGSGALDILFRDPTCHSWIPALFGQEAFLDIETPGGQQAKLILKGNGEHRLKSQFLRVYGYRYWDWGEIGLPQPDFLIDYEHSPYELDANTKISSLTDLSGNEIIFTAPEANRPTMGATGITFNGTSQFLEAANASDLDFTTEDMSFFIFGKNGGNGASSTPAWIGKYSATGWVIDSDAADQNKLRLRMKDSDDVALAAYALTTSFTGDSNFHRILGVVDRDTMAYIYDGATQKGASNPGASSLTITNTGKLRIADLAGANFANLVIKTIAIWKSKLTETQRAAIVAYFGG